MYVCYIYKCVYVVSVLELGSVLPSYSHLVRWLGEPVKAVSIATDVFIKNKKGICIYTCVYNRE